MHIALHINPTQKHQWEHAEWLSVGFERHGIDLDVTTVINLPADIHIVSGPHYARNKWLGHPKVIWLDRALYHDEKSDHWISMPWVSLAWMDEHGNRMFEIGEGREPPKIKNRAGKEGTIYLASYNEVGCGIPCDEVRLHPDNKKYDVSLENTLSQYKKAIGRDTTALVKAGLMGLEIQCLDPDYIMSQPDWLEKLPYADWRYDEIQSGLFWEHLCEQL